MVPSSPCSLSTAPHFQPSLRPNPKLLCFTGRGAARPSPLHQLGNILFIPVPHFWGKAQTASRLHGFRISRRRPPIWLHITQPLALTAAPVGPLAKRGAQFGGVPPRQEPQLPKMGPPSTGWQPSCSSPFGADGDKARPEGPHTHRVTEGLFFPAQMLWVHMGDGQACTPAGRSSLISRDWKQLKARVNTLWGKELRPPCPLTLLLITSFQFSAPFALSQAPALFKKQLNPNPRLRIAPPAVLNRLKAPEMLPKKGAWKFLVTAKADWRSTGSLPAHNRSLAPPAAER